MKTLNYSEIGKELRHYTDLSPAEIHGIICGYTCLHITLKSSDVLKLIRIKGVKQRKPSKKIKEMLAEMIEYSQQTIQNLDFEFQLLLPSSRTKLQTRARALSAWCQGFLIGMHQVHERFDQYFNTEPQQAIKHFAAIAQLEHDNIHTSEDDENAYEEVMEYVRMVVLMLYSEYHRGKEKHQSKIH